MKPIAVSVEVSNPPHQVYEFLDDPRNHESFTDHFLVDWEFSGSERGVGARLSARVKAPGEGGRTQFEVVEADADRRLVEESVGGPGGKRRLRGTYLLSELPGVGTRIDFTLEPLELPLRERLLGPLNRANLRRLNGKAMRRLAERLTALNP